MEQRGKSLETQNEITKKTTQTTAINKFNELLNYDGFSYTNENGYKVIIEVEELENWKKIKISSDTQWKGIPDTTVLILNNDNTFRVEEHIMWNEDKWSSYKKRFTPEDFVEKIDQILININEAKKREIQKDRETAANEQQEKADRLKEQL